MLHIPLLQFELLVAPVLILVVAQWGKLYPNYLLHMSNLHGSGQGLCGVHPSPWCWIPDGYVTFSDVLGFLESCLWLSSSPADCGGTSLPTAGSFFALEQQQDVRLLPAGNLSLNEGILDPEVNL